jgi:hypothetical protein
MILWLGSLDTHFDSVVTSLLIVIFILKSPDHYKTILIKDGIVQSIEEQTLTIEQSESSRYVFSKLNLLSLNNVLSLLL